jgi:hypothetical protein
MKTISYNEILYRAAEAAGRVRDNLPLPEAALLKSVFALELPRIWAGEDWDDLRRPLLAVTLDSAKSFSVPLNNIPRVIVSGAGDSNSNGTYLLGADPAYPTMYYKADGTCWLLGTPGNYGIHSGYIGNPLYFSGSLTGPWTNLIGLAQFDPPPTSVYNAERGGDILGIYDQPPTGSTPWQRLDFSRTGDTITVAPNPDTAAPVPDTVYVYYQAECPDLLALSSTDLAALTLPLFLGNYLALIGAAHLLLADGANSLAGVQLGLAEGQLNFERTRIQRPRWART